MLNVVAGMIGIAVQAALFAGVYLLASPRRGRSLALLFAAIVAVDGYALITLGAMVVGVPWQVSNVVVAVGIGLALLSSRLRLRLHRHSLSLMTLLRFGWAPLTILAALMSIQVVAAALAPELSIDGQLYHGPALAQLVQHGTVWGWQTPNQYIYYTDLTMVAGLNLATFTGAAVFDNGVQLPHLVMLILAINAALRVRFVSPWLRFAFAAIIVAAPAVWIQPRILYVDVAYAAAVVATVVILATAKHTRPLDLIAGAVAGASIVAIKPQGILTGAFLLLAFAVVVFLRMRRAGFRPGAAIGRIAAVGLPVAALASGFYVRNYVVFGNPVFPVKTSLGPIQLPGIVDFDEFASGERGSGLVDPFRWSSYVGNIGDGVLHGVLKTDYDPRSGGFGHIPLIVLGLALILVVAQLIVVLRRQKSERRFGLENWKLQLVFVASAAVILLIQPATFDARYVIGPTVLLCLALLLTSFRIELPRAVAVVAGTLALVAAGGQIVWTEINVYPGLNDVRQLRNFPDEWQPVTPGSVWGRGENVAWLPDDADCHRIALQTSGGVSESGMREGTILSTLPYGLYGDRLCNQVDPIQIETYEGEGVGVLQSDPTVSADYLVLFSSDVRRWNQLLPDGADCWLPVRDVPGSESYPIDVEVFANSCVR